MSVESGMDILRACSHGSEDWFGYVEKQQHDGGNRSGLWRAWLHGG